MQFLRSALLSFYDHPQSWETETVGRGSHVSAVTGIIGEDLVLGLFVHYLQSQGHQPHILSYQCKAPGLRGKRLDAWIVNGRELYQVEVKNWSGHSLGGYNLPENATSEALQRFAQLRWQRFFGAKELPKEIEKVLLPMEPPGGYRGYKRRKLLCFWSYVVGPKGGALTTHPINGEKLDVFSASAYLRTLGTGVVDLQVPRIEARMRLMDSLVHYDPI